VETSPLEPVLPSAGAELALRADGTYDDARSFPPLPQAPQDDGPPAAEGASAPSVDEVLASGDTDQLWQIADAARLSGDTDLATRALLRVRERHPGVERAHRAAYLLGRMAQEVQAEPAVASRWYEVYLAESPGGPLAEEALGRQILAYDAAGEPDLARETAQAYLQRFPDGSFAGVAGSIGER